MDSVHESDGGGGGLASRSYRLTSDSRKLNLSVTRKLMHIGWMASGDVRGGLHVVIADYNKWCVKRLRKLGRVI